MRFLTFLLAFSFLFAQKSNAQQACHINDLTVVTGDCNDDGTYHATINFDDFNPSNDSFKLWVNNDLFGVFSLDSLPLHIAHFPTDGGPNDVVKVCILGNNDCCGTKEFPIPVCAGPCAIHDLAVTTGDCNQDGTYQIKINFVPVNPGNAFFEVWNQNGTYLGYFPLTSLPLTISHFPTDGGPNDVVKVCINDHPNCCATKEFHVPACLGGDCQITNMIVETGDCNADGTYQLRLNFTVANPGNASFKVYGNNGQLIGTYLLTSLPLQINNFATDGGVNDVVKVCIVDHTNCCATKEFPVPACINNLPCHIYDLTATAVDCANGQFWMKLKFTTANVGNGGYQVLINGAVYGTYPYSQNPLVIGPFPGTGTQIYHILVRDADHHDCADDATLGPVNCGSADSCAIHDLTVTTGDCNQDGTYQITINFIPVNPGNASFEVWNQNGTFLGNFPLTSLPLTITHFPTDGGDFDLIKVCINDHPHCCETKEFHVPACVGGDCHITDLTVTTGDCNQDGTYHLTLNFHVANPGNASFKVYGNNGQLIGTYLLTSLPLHIPNFGTDGGVNDVVKVCIVDHPNCCATKEFPVPACVGQGNCHIYDLVATVFDCINGQFKVKLTFKYANVGNAGFTVQGNGHNYGTFQYSQVPITLGPLTAGSGLNYEFVVKDVNHPDCQASVNLGPVNCTDHCVISNLTTETGDCNNDGTYHLRINFVVTNPGNDSFQVWGNANQFLGTFALSSLPLEIEHFPKSAGGIIGHVKVCIKDNPNCCKVKEFHEPICKPGFWVFPNPAHDDIYGRINNANGPVTGTGTVDIFSLTGVLMHSEVVPDAGNFHLDIANLPLGIYHIHVATSAGAYDGMFVKN